MTLARGADEGSGEDASEAAVLPVRVRFTSGSIVRAVLVVMAFSVVVQVVGAAADPIVWFVEGATGAAIFYPVVVVLSRKMPHAAAVALVSVGLVVFVALVGLRLFTELKGEAEQFQSNAPQIAANIESSSTVGEAAKQFGLGDKIERLANDVAGAFNFNESSVSALSTAASIGSSLFIVWLFGVMMLFSAPAFLTGAQGQIRSERSRDRARTVVAAAYANAWQYTATSGARSMGYGLATWVLAWSTDLQAPTLLAVWVALWSFVPAVGLLIGGMLVAIIAMFSSFATAGVLLTFFVIAQILDVQFLQRRIDRNNVHVGPALTLVAAIIGFGLYGFGGVVVFCTWTFFVLAVLDQMRPLHDEVADARVSATPP